MNGKKVQGDTGSSTKPLPTKNLRTEATASATAAAANMNFEIRNSKISISTLAGVNIFEFDVTGTTDANFKLLNCLFYAKKVII
ncbi:MAG: hypothetical protein EAZ53_11385 [Bacteroidetes bacterium]|nr:MAG: hypothetical protein EAZ53_11385 [Bacteroidota bacterium]